MWAPGFSQVVVGALWITIDLLAGLIAGPVVGRPFSPAGAESAARFRPRMVLPMPTLVPGAAMPLAHAADTPLVPADSVAPQQTGR